MEKGSLPWNVIECKKPDLTVAGRSSSDVLFRRNVLRFFPILPAEVGTEAQTLYPIIGFYELKLRSECTICYHRSGLFGRK
ncbi:hypothetical protein Q31a_39970 [Aureliella helgolandensis]|uniref:Uncharacterized protein n=1 Tax=Aureliella helgolandensis TaxID=2527968 RepID=A0A518GAW0_9BACT|nr:hypothetical protein Q31a_39970 [Aureliella helgolandensis]